MRTELTHDRAEILQVQLPARANLWLMGGVVLLALVGLRFNLGILGWVVAVPWLVYLRRTRGLRSRASVVVGLLLGYVLSISKIITPPIPWLLVFMYAVPLAAVASVVYLGFESLRRQLGDRWGIVLFPSMIVGSEWIIGHLTELGTWGALGYSQLDNLPFMQLASIVGLGGLSFVLATSSALIAVVIDRGDRKRWLGACAGFALLVVAAHLYGVLRLWRPVAGPAVVVGMVSSDIGPRPDGTLPSSEELARLNDALFARTVSAAARGAELIVWNEAATLIEAPEEEGFIARGQRIASELGVDVVLAYGVPLDGMQRWENKYVWLSPTGAVETYYKNHPVPGEGSTPGTAKVQVLRRPYGNVAGAICYDFDFPALGREHGENGAGLVAVPSSDWRGIDIVHAGMASVRGIENGYSVVRPARWATSMAFDAYGVARARGSWFEGQRLLIASVPVAKIDTVYGHLGDFVPLASGLVVALGLLLLIVRKRHRHPVAPSPSRSVFS